MKNVVCVLILGFCGYCVLGKEFKNTGPPVPANNVATCESSVMKAQSSGGELSFLASIFDTSDWPARWSCGNWTSFHGWLYIISDTAIWLAYFAIPFCMGYFFIKRNKDIPFKTLFLLFVCFIVACGLTHLMDAVIFWWPAYRFSAILRLGTALVSWGTVFGLVRIAPFAMELKSPNQLQKQVDNQTDELQALNDELKKEIESRKVAEAQLKKLNESLENKVEERTRKLSEANKKLKTTNDLFLEVQEAAQIGVWESDIINKKSYWSNIIYDIYERDYNKPVEQFDFVNYTGEHADRLEKVVEKGISQGSGWDIELLLNTDEGNQKWVRSTGFPIVKNGKTVGFRGLFQDIHSLKKQQLALESANKELEAFSYSVSHDLRSPLRAIYGFSQALKEDYEDSLDESGKYFLDRICAATTRMGELIDDLLALSRISRAQVNRERLDINAIINKIIQENDYQPKAEFVIDEPMFANGDKKLINILYENLISNAVKYSSKKDTPHIEIGTTKYNGKYMYFVKDNGAGFEMKFADKLFVAFQRLHTNKEFDGIGIGLATVKRIVNKHGGDIIGIGEQGKGATFYFSLD